VTSLSDERSRTTERELTPGAVFPYERILLAFAELPQVEEVFQLALHLAAGPGRELFLLRVVPGGWERGGEARMDEQSLYSELKGIHMLLRTEEIPARLEALPAPGAEAVVAYAEEQRVDLIIVVGREANGGSFRQLGEELLRQAPCTAMMLCGVPRGAAEKPAGRQGGGPAAFSLAQGADPAAMAMNG